ncbi:hypothetical protein L209DRAFT_750636 [Thermothelomyces heterothallicus CBS 203.75]
MDAPIVPPIPSKIRVDDRSLRPITLGVSNDAAIDAPVPEVRATTTDQRCKDFDMNRTTHVVIQVTISRQMDIFRCIGYQYDWNYPGPFWHFLGKMVAKAVFDSKTELRELNFVAVGRREFVAFTTSMWRAAEEAKKEAEQKADEEGGKAVPNKTAAEAAELPPLSVIEVNFKKPQPGKPFELAWAPARGLFTAKIRECRPRFT